LLAIFSFLFSFFSFRVFGTDVMVTVAKSFDAPIKLLFPQFGFGFEGALRPSMLGLGDIVIPGIFIALLLRYDIWRNIQRVRAAAAAKAVSSSSSSGAAAPAPLSLAAAHDLECLYCHMTAHASTLRLDYFSANLVAYFLGLSTTVWVMYSFGAAQPALLYLVPACLGCSLLQALVRGDLATLRRYTENEDDKAAAEAADKKKNDDATGVAVAEQTSEAAATDDAAAAPQSPSEGEPRTPSTRARKVSASGSGSSKKKKAGGSSSKKKKSVRAE
jgi:minor histocompatibility antigen H13